jgi:carboxyl-terminal processing protease
MANNVRKAATLLLVLVLITGIFVLVVRYTPRPTSEGADLVSEAWEYVFDHFVDREGLDPDEVSEGAIRGMIEALDDPWSLYFDAEEYQLIQSGLAGKFGGIGAHVTLSDGQITISEPIEGGPAEKAGIIAGDKILEIDGESTEGLSLDEAVMKIRGEKGTEVRLLIQHPGDEEPVEILVIRDVIQVDTVEVEILDEDVARIEVSRFTSRTTTELESALESVLGNGTKGLVLDLRDNPGGVLDVAVSVTSQFLDDGIALYSLDGEGNRKDYSVEAGGLALDIPLVVLVNGGSASASEIVAGALQDYDQAILIGEATRGKGSVNADFKLSDGSAIRLTIRRWYTPDGREIEGNGLTPDIEVELTQEDREQGRDPQLERALEVVQGLL